MYDCVSFKCELRLKKQLIIDYVPQPHVSNWTDKINA